MWRHDHGRRHVNVRSRPKIVVLGMMSKIPVAGVVWQTLHYLLGFERLGFAVYYVEAHARTPSMFMRHEGDDASELAATTIATVMRRFGMEHRWAFHALHADGRCYGLSERELMSLYSSAALIINLHGGTEPRPEHSATGRLIYLETDPVALQIELFHGRQETIDFLAPHSAFFTFGENYGNPDCGLPVSDRFTFRPTRQPVVVELWRPFANAPGELTTTIGNWRQPWREVHFRGEVFHWSKHHEFLKFLDLPHRTGLPFELALSSYTEADRELLAAHGWHVRPALDFSTDLDAYRDYIAGSRAEFTAAKDQNIRLRSGWFSDRAATYLAAGRPVITQDTGFGNSLPTGEGLFAVVDVEGATAACRAVEADYPRHRRAALAVANDYFDYGVVLTRLLSDVGMGDPRRTGREPSAPPGTAATDLTPFPADLLLEPVSRRPLRLAESTLLGVLTRSDPRFWRRTVQASTPGTPLDASPAVSIIVVTLDNLALNRLCLESILLTTERAEVELIVVDNGSTDETPAYLRDLAMAEARVRPILNGSNVGYAAANNQGLAVAHGEVLILLNNDVIVPPGWLTPLCRHLDDTEVGLVGPVTNRIGNEAQVPASYRTIGEFMAFAQTHMREHHGERFDIRMLALFCAAMTRAVFQRVGPLDEQFVVGMLEDEDYAIRMRAAGYRVVCAEDVFVHHFSQATFGELIPSGEYHRVHAANRHRLEEKWQRPWQPNDRRPSASYQELVERVREVACASIPVGGTVLVVSKGDDELLRLDGRRAWHFPRDATGVYAGYHPADSAEAVHHLEQQRAAGAEYLLIPHTAFWWLEHYAGFREHLESSCHLVAEHTGTCLIYALGATEPVDRQQ